MALSNNPRHPGSASPSHQIALTLAVLAVLVAIAAIATGPNLLAWYRSLAYDAPYYIWRTNLVSASGLGSLASTELSGTVINPDRAGFAVVASLVGSAVRVDPVALLRTMQVATTLAISLAAGAFAVEVLEEPAWSLPLYVLVMGVSAQLARTSIGSLDNLLVDAVLLVIAVAVIGSVEPGRGRSAAIAGFAAAAVIHWFFTALFLVLLVGVAVCAIPWSIAIQRRGVPASQTPSAIMAIEVAGGAIAAAVALFGLAPGLPVRVPPAQGNHGNLTRLPYFRLPFTGALAMLGGLSLWRPDTLKRRIGLLFLGLWGVSVAVAMLVSRLGSGPIKIFRVAGFDLAIPLLGAAALVGALRLGRRFGAPALTGAVVVVVAGLLALGVIGVAVYRSPASSRLATRLERVRDVAGYVRSLPPERPVVFLSTLPDPHGAFRLVLAGLPGDRIGGSHLYVGEARDLLAGRAGAQDADAPLAAVAAGWWAEAWGDAAQIVREDPVIIYLDGLNRTGASPPPGATAIAPGVLVLHGPPAGATVGPDPIEISTVTLALQVIAALLLFGVVGSGWTRWLVPVGPLGWCALSPAVGIAAMALLGTTVGKVGGPSGGPGGLVVLIGIATLGWLPLLVRSIGRRSRPNAAA